MEQLDLFAVMDIVEILVGFLLGNAARLRLLKPRDWTIMLQVALFGIKILRWAVTKYHPVKKDRNLAGVDADLTRMHQEILREHGRDNP